MGSVPEDEEDEYECGRSSGDDSVIEARPDDAPDPDTDSSEDGIEVDIAVTGDGVRWTNCDLVSMLK